MKNRKITIAVIAVLVISVLGLGIAFVASLRTPGDSITYNFKIHNTGDYAATVSSVVMASGVNLTTNTEARTSEANPYVITDYYIQ